MAQPVTVHLEVPGDLARFRLPEAVDRRLQQLLGKQSRAGGISDEERAEAEGLVDLAEMMTLLSLRAQRATQDR